METQTKQKFTFFWGGTFSQWAPSNFVIDGILFTHAEQYMMYKKAMLFSDTETAKQIMEAKHPREQKALGRKVVGFDKDLWESNCKQYVYDANYAKFTQNASMLKDLMDTGDTEMVEASPEDKIWGIGLHEDDPRAHDKSTWLGTNWLGEALTKLRADLSKQAKSIKGEISFEDFIKADMRICLITSVTKVPKADKLYILKIKTGFDERIVVSAIADKFTPEQLLNKKMPFVLNLTPRKIKGIESFGMILMAEGKDGTLYDMVIDNAEVGAVI